MTKRALALLFTFLLLFSACGKKEVPPAKEKLTTEYFTLQSEEYFPKLSATGVLEADLQAPVGPKATGRIQQLHVDIGDFVREGELLGVLALDESGVTAAYTEKDLINMEKNYAAQEKLMNEQIEGARRSLEVAEANFDAIKGQKKTTTFSSIEQVKLAERSVERSDQDLANARSIAKRNIESLYKGIPSTVRSAYISGKDAINFGDFLVGATRTQRNTTHGEFRGLLGFQDQSTKIDAKSTVQDAIRAQKKIINKYDPDTGGIKVIRSSEEAEVEVREPTRAEYDQLLEDMVEFLKATQEMNKSIQNMLNNSATGENLSPEQLQQWQATGLQQAQSIESSLISANGGGVKGTLIERDRLFTNSQADVSDAEKALLESEQNLNQVKAGGGKQVLDIQGQVVVAQEQVGQAKIAVSSAEAQKVSTLTNLQREIDQVKGNLGIANVGISNNAIVAPFDGVILTKEAEVGEVVSVGQPVFIMANPDLLKIVTDIPDVNAKDVSVGLEAEVEVDGAGGTGKARIIKVYPSVDPTSRKLGIELLLEQIPPGAKIGMFGRLDIHLPKKEAFFVPKFYVKQDFNGPYILLENGERKDVKTGEERGDEIRIWFHEIKNGIGLRSV